MVCITLHIIYVFPTFAITESCDLEITVTSKETESDQEGMYTIISLCSKIKYAYGNICCTDDTSPAAGIISGSVFGIVLIAIVIGIIILTVIMCIRNPG